MIDPNFKHLFERKEDGRKDADHKIYYGNHAKHDQKQ